MYAATTPSSYASGTTCIKPKQPDSCAVQPDGVPHGDNDAASPASSSSSSDAGLAFDGGCSPDILHTGLVTTQNGLSVDLFDCPIPAVGRVLQGARPDDLQGDHLRRVALRRHVDRVPEPGRGRAMRAAGMTEAWQGELLKAQAMNESGITPDITTDDTMCGGQNCGIWAISAGSASGDSPPGPCGSSAVDPFTGTVDYSHSYGLFQETPACEGTFLRSTLPSGYSCTGTTEADNIPFGASVTFYCDSATSLGVTISTGTVKGYIDAVQSTSDALYATSIFNPAYQIYVYLDHTWAISFAQANAGATGCTLMQQWYLSLAYWLTGSATTSCTLTGPGLEYVQTAISNYEMLYGKAWPYPGP